MKCIFRGHTIFEYKPEKLTNQVIQPMINNEHTSKL
jgi:hypothetical protein